MTDEIDIKLPVSGKTVTIRNYTTRADDEKAEDVLYLGVTANEVVTGGEVEKTTKFPLANVMASQDVYVKRLVKSIDGNNQDIFNKLLELRSDDYKAIQDAVEKITDEHSPKA